MSAESGLKRGAVREDGMVFWQYHPNYPRGERWVSRDVFDKKKASHRESKRRLYAKDPKRFSQIERSRWGALPKEVRRDYTLKRNFGIGINEYNAMLDAQGGVCAICKERESVIRYGAVIPLAVDHCHDTGTVRGLLCARCNIAIGHLNDNPFIAMAASKYLSADRARQPIALTK